MASRGLPAPASPPHTAQMEPCKAMGRGWRCERRAKTKGYCEAHYMQQRRGKELAPIQDPDAREEQTVRHVALPAEWDALLVWDAEQQDGGNVSASYRRALKSRVDALRKRRDAAGT